MGILENRLRPRFVIQKTKYCIDKFVGRKNTYRKGDILFMFE
jgi:hypothetical protein